MDYQAFAERTKGKSFDELVHEGKHRAQQLLEDQGIVAGRARLLEPTNTTILLPAVIIVSGPPCAGKTTLARRLATHFSLPLMTKDIIKEILFDTLGWHDRAWSKQLSRASIELLYRFTEAQVAARRSCVIESNFYAELATPTLLDLKQRYPFEPVQIQCCTEASVLIERFRCRALSGERHPGHVDQGSVAELRPDLVREQLEPLAIGGQLIELDTTDFDTIDYEALFAQIRGWLRYCGVSFPEEHVTNPRGG